MSSLVLIKPDAIKLKLLGWCIACFETYGIEQMRIVLMDQKLCAEHYVDHIAKDFYPGLEKFMCSAPLCALAVTGDVEAVRKTAMSIRNKWREYVSGPNNLIHASDSSFAAKRELSLWFNSQET